MLRNFLKITVRNFLKNKSYVFINLTGLGLALACCIVGYLNYDFAASYDQNHINHQRIYKIQVNKSVQEENVPYGISPLPLGHQVRGQFPGITHTARYISNGLVVKKELKVINQEVGFADDDFFEMFTFDFKYGNKDTFLDRSSIILSEEMAGSYFGAEMNPVGEIVTVISEEGDKYPMTVGAVLESIPRNSSIRPAALTHFDNYLKIRGRKNDEWKYFMSGTFIMTVDESYPSHVLKQLNENYIAIQNLARNDWKVDSYYLEKLTTMGVNNVEIRSNWLNEPPPPPAVAVPMIMAILMLLIACFNFTNTSIAISSKRLKEIGIRKVMGGNRKQLILQFMGENLVLSFLSMLVGLLTASFLVPAYSAMWDFITLELDMTNNLEIYTFLTGLLIFTSVAAGAYPSIYISSYQPVKILRGNLNIGGTNILSRILLATQYSLTVTALVSSLAFSNNATYQNQLDVGFEKENIIGVRMENQSDYQRFSSIVAQLPVVQSLAGSSEHIGWWTYGRTLRNADREIEADMMDFGIDYQDVMDLKVTNGRYFNKDLYEHDQENSILVNEQLVNEFGWEQPIGQVLQIDDSTRLSVVGVLKDFHMYGFFNPVDPLGVRLSKKDKMNFVIVRGSGNPTALYEQLEKSWYGVSPNTPFNAQYQDVAVRESELVNKNITVMFLFLGILALVLSSIGLYTLVSLNILKRVKEIGIRKVLGASIRQILNIMNRQFVIILLIAAVIGAGLSYLAIDSLMASIFANYKATGFFTFLVPILVLFIIAFVIASGKTLSAAVKNPVESLRSE